MSGVGVIVPVYGEGPYLPETLDSVFAQVPQPDQVVVVDDGSPEPVSLPARHEARCRLVRRPQRGGPGPARATGLEALQSGLIALADADDVWEAGKLAAQLQALGHDPGAAVCFGPVTVVDRAGAPTGERWDWPAGAPLDGEQFVRRLFEHNPIALATTVIRRDRLVAAGGFHAPAPLAEDYDLWLRLAARGERFLYEPQARVRLRRHDRSLSWDIAALASSLLTVREVHAGLVDPVLARRMRALDLRAYAQGSIRRRGYADARRALAQAAELEPPNARMRALAAAVRVPGLRGALGRRYPYR